MNQDGFCGNCGSPRVQGQSECPQCHTPYGGTYTGQMAVVENTTRSGPTVNPVIPPTTPAPGNTPTPGTSSPSFYNAGTVTGETAAPPTPMLSSPGYGPASPYPGGMPSGQFTPPPPPPGMMVSSPQYPAPMQQSQPLPVSPPPGAHPSGAMPMQPAGKKSSLTRNFIIGQTALNIILLVLVGVLIGTRQPSPGGPGTSPTATSISQVGTTPAQHPTNTPVTAATNTPGSAAATNTPGASGTPTTPGATATPGVITKNLQLVCQVTPCDDPVIVTIETITIDTTLQRMVWSVSLQNKLSVGLVCGWTTFKLSEPIANQNFPGSIVTLSGNLNAGQIRHDSITFPFVPYVGVNYILSATISSFNCASADINFAPVTFTF